MRAVSNLADKGPSNLLLTLGTIILIISLFMKLKVFGIGLAELQPSEFITLVLVSTFLLVAGSYLGLYQYKNQQEINRGLRQAGVEMLQRQGKTAIEFAKAGVQPSQGTQGAQL